MSIISDIERQLLDKTRDDTVLNRSFNDFIQQHKLELREKELQKKEAVELLPAQIKFMNSDADNVLYRGGIRSGKTYIGAWWSINKCNRGQSVLAIAPTYGMLIDNMVATLILICEQYGIPYRWLASRKRFYVGSAYIIMRTAENYDTIRGFEACHMWFDEISFAQRNGKKAYDRGWGRLSGMKNHIGKAQCIMTSSPNGFDFACELSQTESCQLVTQRIKDNWFLDEDYILQLMDKYKGRYAAQELDAEIVDWGGAFFDFSNLWTASDDTYIVNTAQAFDLAFTKKKSSDYSAHGVGGANLEGDFVLQYLDQWKSRIPETKKKIIKKVNEDFPNATAWIEANGTQVSVYDDLIYSGLSINPITNVNKGKVTRMFPMASAIEAGSFAITKSCPMREEFITQGKMFSLDDSHDHDDLLDVVNNVFLKTAFFGESKPMFAV